MYHGDTDLNMRLEWGVAVRVFVPLRMTESVLIRNISYMTHEWSDAPYVVVGGTDTLWRILNNADVVKRPVTPSTFRISSVFDKDGNPTDDLGIWFEWDDSEQ